MNSIEHCIKILIYELKHYLPYLQKIIICGKDIDLIKLFNDNKVFRNYNIIIISNPFYFNYNKEMFEKQLINALNYT